MYDSIKCAYLAPISRKNFRNKEEGYSPLGAIPRISFLLIEDESKVDLERK